ncbi:hypothetical protein V9T40_007161 [Parthenolecanium corni]|uniref:CCZ1/INTU/HSP4 first Longin domain-containing protein n=1 Tax=Parthenolecanium corni TaxID=536013 RepID=A0AAN9U4P6_9HEMI
MNSLRENNHEIPQVDNFQQEPSSSTSGSSCSSCCDYHSDDSIPEWDDSVQDNGELFYVKCSPIINDLSLNDDSINKNYENVSKTNKISTFLRKRKAKKRAKKVGIGTPIRINENVDSVKTDRSGVASFEDITKNSAAILYLNVENVDNHESSIGDSTIFHFPKTAPTHENIINSIKGAFLTLYHLLPKVVSEKPESSTIFIKDELLHVVYIGEDKELMIIALPDNKCSLFEVKQISQNIKRFLIFKFGSLHKCFTNHDHINSLDQFFGNLFIKLLKNSNDLSSSKILSENDVSSQIEDLFSFPSRLPIPTTLETKIHEKLNDIEANDFGDLSEDHYGCQRLFTLIGTCLYYKGFLIASHLSREDLLNVHIFLCYNDILDLSTNSFMESLVIWQEVFLFSSHFAEASFATQSKKRWFLLITGKKQGLLVTLFESGGCSVSSEGSIRPDELYVEQIQEIMNDILHFNLSDIVDKLTESGNTNNHKSTPRKSLENLMNVPSGSAKKLHECGAEFNPSHHSSAIQVNGAEADSFSESLSRTTSSLFSDEAVPVIGRRAQRMKQLNNSGSIYSLSHSTLSDSDRSDYDTTGSSHSSSFSEANKKFSKTSSSKRIIHGDERALFYYLTVQTGRGVILCSPTALQMHIHRRYPSILKTFKTSVQKIHRILSQKKPCSVGKFQRNNLSVKEYGILFEYHDQEDISKRSAPITYWIVGRAFDKGHSGEVYVCYEDKTPQNLVEIAFRLAMSS